MTLVKVNHSGNCTSSETKKAYYYTVGVPVELPDEILLALGEDSYEVLESEKSAPAKKEEKPETKQEEKPEAKKEPVKAEK